MTLRLRLHFRLVHTPSGGPDPSRTSKHPALRAYPSVPVNTNVCRFVAARGTQPEANDWRPGSPCRRFGLRATDETARHGEAHMAGKLKLSETKSHRGHEVVDAAGDGAEDEDGDRRLAMHYWRI
jgi:hypothetical protein